MSNQNRHSGSETKSAAPTASAPTANPAMPAVAPTAIIASIPTIIISAPRNATAPYGRPGPLVPPQAITNLTVPPPTLTRPRTAFETRLAIFKSILDAAKWDIDEYLRAARYLTNVSTDVAIPLIESHQKDVKALKIDADGDLQRAYVQYEGLRVAVDLEREMVREGKGTEEDVARATERWNKAADVRNEAMMRWVKWLLMEKRLETLLESMRVDG